MTCRTRFAPSPTGFLHIGGARTALYCYLEARRRGGQFVLRVEDTDRERSTQEAVQAILDAMDWMGLEYDEGPIYQTQRLDRYREVAEQMVADGKAYYAYETKEELEAMRDAALAIKEKPRYNGAYRDANAPFRDDPLLFEPGTKYSYSTYGFDVLGCVMQGSAGKSFMDVIRSLVFAPAGM